MVRKAADPAELAQKITELVLAQLPKTKQRKESKWDVYMRRGADALRARGEKPMREAIYREAKKLADQDGYVPMSSRKPARVRAAPAPATQEPAAIAQ